MMPAVRRWPLLPGHLGSSVAISVAVMSVLTLGLGGAIWLLPRQAAPALVSAFAVAAVFQFLIVLNAFLMLRTLRATARRMEEQERLMAERSAELGTLRTELRAVRAELH